MMIHGRDDFTKSFFSFPFFFFPFFFLFFPLECWPISRDFTNQTTTTTTKTTTTTTMSRDHEVGKSRREDGSAHLSCRELVHFL